MCMAAYQGDAPDKDASMVTQHTHQVPAAKLHAGREPVEHKLQVNRLLSAEINRTEGGAARHAPMVVVAPKVIAWWDDGVW